ncbi:MAG: hypothetical protein Q8932_03695 [Bacteroidota bacterium]|nr:hypothetical protein [Bacteroidota bacterium]MDP4244927.1 hypothetical protein [Bacteroidota bacterium]MDP4254812.1 hypothetical protein [Bacteroidota bacterium]MDP4257573.1 hypothetical protein [Bacteroidota bacterium]
MATELKRFPVDNQEQAFELITKLSQQYHLQQDANRHQFHVSNDRYSAYYDAEERVVKIEAIHPHVTQEQIREFLMEFPPFL